MLKMWRNLLAGCVLALGSTSLHAVDPVKIGLVYVSPVGDAGYTYQHDLGRKAIEETFGDKVEVSFCGKCG